MSGFLAFSSLIAMLLLGSAGCNMTSEAAAANTYIGPYSAMHADIPSGAGTAVQEYQ